MEKIISIRGATQASKNTTSGIKRATVELLKELIKQNKLDTNKIINILFTVTSDLNMVHPATVARKSLNLNHVPMLCMQEVKVSNDLPRCIRIMVNVYSKLSKEKIKHIYLGKANKLRPDLK